MLRVNKSHPEFTRPLSKMTRPWRIAVDSPFLANTYVTEQSIAEEIARLAQCESEIVPGTQKISNIAVSSKETERTSRRIYVAQSIQHARTSVGLICLVKLPALSVQSAPPSITPRRCV